MICYVPARYLDCYHTKQKFTSSKHMPYFSLFSMPNSHIASTENPLCVA